jgi:hypothetical protein
VSCVRQPRAGCLLAHHGILMVPLAAREHAEVDAIWIGLAGPVIMPARNLTLVRGFRAPNWDALWLAPVRP